MNSFFFTPLGLMPRSMITGDIMQTDNRIGVMPAVDIRPSSESSLLTFADMVIALEDRNQNENSFDGSTIDDHNYASSSYSLNKSFSSDDSDLDLSDIDDHQSSALLEELNDITSDKIKDSCTSQGSKVEANISSEESDLNGGRRRRVKQCSSCLDHNTKKHIVECPKNVPNPQVNKRSSSVENIKCLCVHNSKTFSSSLSSSDSTCRHNVRSYDSGKLSSPRKSCSFEEVNIDHHPVIKSSRSTENVMKRPSVSNQLHRMVNDNLEFPSWPRKADHTYATATWDGTAASHNLFEEESRQIRNASQSVEQVQGCQEMEVSESSSLGFKFMLTDTGINKDSDQKSEDTVKHLPAGTSSNHSQRDDHTYTVKSKLSTKSILQTAQTASKPLVECLEQCCRDWIEIKGTLNTMPCKTDFSSATFPRQKTRDDHTYFHSGLNKKDTSPGTGRDWVSEQTVMVMECTDNDNAVFHVQAQPVQQPSRATSKTGKKDDSGSNKKDNSPGTGRDWVSDQAVMVMECTNNDNAVFHVQAQPVQQQSRVTSKTGKRDDHSYSTSA